MLPSGTVTFLFTDIEGSTELWDQQPQAMKTALAQHDAILHEAVESQAGTIIKTTGDGVYAVFETAAGALAAALAAQRALLAQPWPATGPLRVRMGLHTGEAEVREGDYFGPPVNRAARLMFLGAGGQVLLSAATAELARNDLPAEATLAALGEHRLQGLEHPERVYQLLHPDLAGHFPPLRSQVEVPTNLPQQLTSFVGRQRELAEVRRLLAQETLVEEASSAYGPPRLITLTGPGGTGKTRLALEAAGNLLDNFPDGVWLAELAPLADPALVTQALAGPMGLREPGGRSLQDVIVDYLRPRRVLLLLDNCEHLIDECARLADGLLQACPKLRILASSREALGIAGEQALRVRSLALPPGQDGLAVEELANYDAVRLFVERAQAVKPGFVLRPENAAAVLQICRRLDGIPLAIELAVARLRVLSVEQIAARLDDRFRLLTGGSRTALPRQRTLQALVDWSYDLLTEPECVLLRRLSVFSGGWTLEAAEVIVGLAPLEPYEVLDLLEQLVSKSLVATEEGDWGMRYRMLETIRQYAQEKLAQSGEADALRQRHTGFFNERSQAAVKELAALRGTGIVDSLENEVDNLRAAREWALEHDLQAALQLAVFGNARWAQIVPPAEGLRFLERALALAEANSLFSGDEALTENRGLVGHGLAYAGLVAFALGLNPRALEYEKRSMAIAREVGDVQTLATALFTGAIASAMLGDMATAQTWRDEARTLVRQSDNRWWLAFSLVSLGDILLPTSPEQAWARWEEGMAMFRQGGDPWGQAWGHQMAALYCLATQEYEAAENHAGRALALFDEAGGSPVAAIANSVRAELARQRGDLKEAGQRYRDLVRLYRDSGMFGAAARCLECLAFIAHAGASEAEGEARATLLEYAATLLGAGDAIRQAHHSPMAAFEKPEYESELASIQEAAGERLFQHGWQDGQAMDFHQAAQYALDGPKGAGR